MSNAPEYGQGEGTLSKAAGLVTDARADFNKIADKLSGQISGVQGKWGGQGASAFFILHTAWNEKQKVIVDALDEFSASLTSTEKDNVATDDAQHASYSSLHNKLG
jgi:WXG100 family type VII secretion target